MRPEVEERRVDDLLIKLVANLLWVLAHEEVEPILDSIDVHDSDEEPC